MSKTENQKDQKEATAKSQIPRYASATLLVILILCYLFLPDFQAFCKETFTVLTSGDRKQTDQWVAQFGAWGPIVLILAQIIQMFLLVVPTLMLMTVSVLAYGPWLGSLYAMIGIVLASVVGYYIGYSAGKSILDKIIGSDTRLKMTRKVNQYGIWIVVMARINPVLSNDTISLISGVVQLSFWKFMLATVLASTPLLILISYLGESAERLKTGMIWLSIGCLVIAVGYFGFRCLKRKS